jgi:hypothetical protein
MEVAIQGSDRLIQSRESAPSVCPTHQAGSAEQSEISNCATQLRGT